MAPRRPSRRRPRGRLVDGAANNGRHGTRCHSSELALSLTPLSAAAGTAYQELLIKNVGGRTCTMEGYPGVSFLDSHGAQIGAAVPRMAGTGGRVTLAPGASAGALVAYHDAYVSTVVGCRPTPASAVKVYPPDETASLTVPTTLMVCANSGNGGTAGVSPVTDTANLHP